MAGPSKSQKEIEENRAHLSTYPRQWSGRAQESPASPAEEQDERDEPSHPAPADAPNSAHANNSGNRSANTIRNTPSNRAAAGIQGSQVGQHPQQRRPGLSRTQGQTNQQHGGPPSTSGNWRARQYAPSDRRAERPFYAMDAIATGKSPNADIPPEVKKRLGFAETYQGDVLNPNNRSDKIREEDSTSLYFYNLHPSMTVKELLDALVPLGPFGRVQQSNVKPPDPKSGHYYCGAKVAMFHRCEAEHLKKVVENIEKPLYIKGLQVFVRWNIQRVADFSKKHPGKVYMSRTVDVKGPRKLVNVEGLFEYFKSKFLFDLQDVALVYEDDNIRHLRWVFASVTAQSEMAFLALKAGKYNGVQFKYGPDPLSRHQREVGRWNSQAHLLPALGNFGWTNDHPNLPPAQNPDALSAPGPRLGDELERITHNNTDEWDQYEQEIRNRQSMYDKASDDEEEDSNWTHFEYQG